MIGFIPKLYPNELLYSFIARYDSHSFNKSPRYTLEELFGRKEYFVVPDLPLDLLELSNNINIFLKIGALQLMHKHTMYNYFTNFVSEDKKNLVKEAMITGGKKGAVHMITGIMASNIKEKKFLLFCSKCAEEDTRQLGETYWRLTHQLPGVYVCTIHQIVLSESSCLYRLKRKDLQLPLVDSEITLQKSIDRHDDNILQFLLNIAKESTSLALKDYHFDLFELQKIYRVLLKRKGLLSIKGMVFQESLATEFEKFYGKDLLSILQSNVDYDNDSCWLKAITRRHRKVFHPIRHILLIHFLGENVGTIKRVNVENNNPFGKGPYLCLNKAAHHYGERVIPQMSITFCSKTKLMIGSFKCKCGFHYSRRASEIELRDEYNISRVKEYGEVWRNKVLDLIHNKKYSFRAAARELGADTSTIIKYSKKLPSKVSMNRNIDNTCLDKKNEWLILIEENPGLSITNLRSINGALYSILYRKEREWLKGHSPKGKRKRTNNRVNWVERDQSIKAEIEKATVKIMNKEPPIRLTISRIGLEIGKRDLLEKHLNKLPKTKVFLSSCVEDKKTFQVRRIKYVLGELNKHNEEINDWKVLRLAGLKAPIEKDVIIAMNELISFEQLGYQ